MREQTMRYCLLALNLALAAMYFLPRETAKAGWLPPATEEELQTAHLRREHILATLGESTATSHAGQSSAAAQVDKDLAATLAHSFTPCEAPVGEPAGSDFGFGL